MALKCVGLIETLGLAAAVEAADTAVKSANVKLIGYEYTKGDGMCTVKVEGDVGAVKAAIAAASVSASKVWSVYSTKVIARPAEGIDMLLHNASQTIGYEDPKAMSEEGEAAKEERKPEPIEELDKKELESTKTKEKMPESELVQEIKEEKTEKESKSIEEEKLDVKPESTEEEKLDVKPESAKEEKLEESETLKEEKPMEDEEVVADSKEKEPEDVSAKEEKKNPPRRKNNRRKSNGRRQNPKEDHQDPKKE